MSEFNPYVEDPRAALLARHDALLERVTVLERAIENWTSEEFVGDGTAERPWDMDAMVRSMKELRAVA